VLVGEPELRRQVAAQVVVDRVDARDEPVQQLASFGRAQVQRQAPRVPVE